MPAVFLLFGHWMEMKARRGSSDSVRKLLDLTPPRATVERDGQQMDRPVAEVVVGDVVILKPGDKVPVDGEVIDGTSAIDESMVTGESVPVPLNRAAAIRSLVRSWRSCHRRGLENDLPVEEFENIAGHGVQAKVGDLEVLVGAQRLLDQFRVPLGPVADAVRPSAARGVAELKGLTSSRS